ncbi:2-keto-3-deoxy-galactonokinase [Tsuneonella dongtanensis]|uniref:2-keto-3-deoxy-galactonokinase n=1 Tax=Tsuneonella dongtanensis TaxID=692370 RepID=A0A1B2AB67_9SPHN|nr:2-dehydro-3-deoxygalactonokinase [Tsuneonella dongtanensis]ANY19285.1 2-keto-3-deoxy-galactonokinase [Tsuneonella dongtanensis]
MAFELSETSLGVTEGGMPESLQGARFVAGDWGTTAARFWLCDEEGNALDAREGAGVATLGGGQEACAAAFDRVTDGWPTVPAMLCGMIGGNIGWREAGYVGAPLPVSDLGRGAVRFEHAGRTVSILPGMRCVNPYGERDVMRGEETQIAGGCAIEGMRDGLFALPGTHNKWIRVEDGRLASFHTAISGELFAALSKNSVLVAPDSAPPHPGKAFDEGVRLSLRHGANNLLGLLFASRVRQVEKTLAREDGASFLSGLIVGADVAGALPQFSDDAPVNLICSDALAASYGRALELAGRASRALSGGDCARRGLALAFARVS